MSFASNLQGAREAAGLSQMDLARQAGISIDSLRNWEQEKALPRIDAVVKLANALHVRIEILTKGMDAPQEATPAKKPTKRKPRGDS